ncbi:MAG: tetraprenyl-beta-curcumene synthase family protein [Firmicutes bacterium]|nr:tetraprenyl-beta-curcumene synthase family protein [Bacillota bacterium]
MSVAALQEPKLIARFVTATLPAVQREIERWERAAKAVLQGRLKEQALKSLKHKRFHAQGGSVYMLGAPGRSSQLVKLIVALQTISDYLDNLCDRMGPQEERSLWLLHQAMLDACSPGSICRDYYAEYPCRGDFGYLPGLVAECQQQVSSLPGYPAAKTEVLALVSLYAHLQTYKHLDKSFRAERLQDWIRPHLVQFPDLYWWEFAAASGSTLGVFALFRRSAQRGMTADEARCLVDAYFPWICGLHILLDYLIDQGEDEEEGDLNFVSFYPNSEECQRRLVLFTKEALARADSLPDPVFHRAVVRGLLALYLSDPKVKSLGLEPLAGELVAAAGGLTGSYLGICRLLRRLRVV